MTSENISYDININASQALKTLGTMDSQTRAIIDAFDDFNARINAQSSAIKRQLSTNAAYTTSLRDMEIAAERVAQRTQNVMKYMSFTGREKGTDRWAGFSANKGYNTARVQNSIPFLTEQYDKMKGAYLTASNIIKPISEDASKSLFNVSHQVVDNTLMQRVGSAALPPNFSLDPKLFRTDAWKAFQPHTQMAGPFQTPLEKMFQKQGTQSNLADFGLTGNLAAQKRALEKAIPSSAQTKLTDFGKKMEDTGKTVKNTTDIHKEHGNGLQNLLTQYFGVTAVVHLAKRAFQEFLKQIKENSAAFRQFEKGMAEVSTIVADVDLHMGTLTAGVTSMSKAFGKDANDVAKALYDILSAAVKVEDSLQLLAIAGKAAVAGLTDMQTSVDIMVAVMNAYGYSVDQMAHASDVLFAGVIRGVFTFDKFESSLGYVIPIAAEVGISLEEITAAMATTTRFGQHLDSVARGLALTIQNIINPSEKARKEAQKFGIDLSLVALQGEGLLGFLDLIGEKTKGNESAIGRIIPNMRSFRVAMVLAGGGAAAASLDFDIMKSALGATDVAFSKVAASTQFAKDQLAQYTAEVKRSVGAQQQELDFLADKVELFKTFAISDIMTPSKTDILLSVLSPVLGVGNMLAGAWNKSSTIYDKARADAAKQMATAYSDFNKTFDLTEADPDNRTFYQKMFDGDKIDLSGYDVAIKQVEDKTKKATDLSATLFDLSQGIFEKDPKKMSKALIALGESPINPADWKNDSNAVLDTVWGIQENWKSTLGTMVTDATTAKEGLSKYTSIISEGKLEVEKYHDQIVNLCDALKDLKEEIGEVGNVFDGTLGHQYKAALQSHSNEQMSHYLSLAIKEERYQVELAGQGYTWYDSKVEEAIKVIRAYENAQKAAAKETREFNFALAENALAMKRIQLIGMMRRRGNTRSEERMMKSLSIERTQLEIIQAVKDLERERADLNPETESGSSYEDAKRFIDNVQMSADHALWLLNEVTKNDQIKEMYDTIIFKEQIYTDNLGYMKTAYENITTAIGVVEEAANAFFDGQDEQFNEWLANYQKVMANLNIETAPYTGSTGSGGSAWNNNPLIPDAWNKFLSPIMGYASGTSYVPRTGLYQLHQGEAVIPANKNNGSGTTVIINVTGNTIDQKSEQHIAELIGSAVQRGLMDANGRSKYRVR